MIDMNRIEIQERVKELIELRVRWINENRIPVEKWTDSPYRAEFERLADLLWECSFGKCECTEEQHELSEWSTLKLAVHIEKGRGNFEPMVDVQRMKVQHVSDVETRRRMLSEIKFIRAGAVRVDKAELLAWKRYAKQGDEKFVKILEVRDAAMSAKNRERARGGVITV